MTDSAALKEKAALSSILASVALTIGKLAAGLASGSLALLSESAHSAVDTGATILTYFAVREANKPADDRHHYGHGKYESLAALAETGLLAGLSFYVLTAALHRLFTVEEHIDASWPVFAVLVVAIATDLTRWLGLRAVARKTGSQALAADAMHFASDLLSSTLVLIGLIASAYGFKQGDALAAVGVSIFIAIAGYHLAQSTLDTLLDAAPEGLADTLRAVVARTPGVVDVQFIKLRPNGSHVLGEIGIAVARTLPIERVAAIEAEVLRRVAEASPETHANVTVAPRALDDETLMERVMLIAARRKLPVHHVMVQHVGDRDCIAFDLELDGAMPHGQAHEIASALEDDIRDEIGAEIEVESHIEPLHIHPLAGKEADGGVLKSISGNLRQLALQGGVIRDIHDVRARQTESGLVVAFHGRVDPMLNVEEAHAAIDALERGVREHTPGIARIVGHAEALRAL